MVVGHSSLIRLPKDCPLLRRKWCSPQEKGFGEVPWISRTKIEPLSATAKITSKHAAIYALLLLL